MQTHSARLDGHRSFNTESPGSRLPFRAACAASDIWAMTITPRLQWISYSWDSKESSRTYTFFARGVLTAGTCGSPPGYKLLPPSLSMVPTASCRRRQH